MGKRCLATACAVVAALSAPASALAFGPGAQDGDKAIDNCVAAFQRQLANGTTAGGGPKAGEPGPLNCDHFFQDEGSPAANHIGNGWPPPPFQP
jgi:hypothetical protein